MKLLIIAPHPDDEILGCGGTIARFSAENHDVYVAIMTKGCQPLYTEEFVERGRQQARKAHELLGVKETFFFDFPAAAIDRVPHADLNKALGDLICQLNPDMLFIPHNADIHLDHQLLFTSALVAARPNKANYPKKIFAYETLSETNWNAPLLTPAFHPNAFIDITGYLDNKIQAFAAFEDQVKPAPHERSLETIKALAILRGSTVHRAAAEAFIIVRDVI